ncbi:MAG: AI-2E family transporter [Erysipelotrichaceae bacterium]
MLKKIKDSETFKLVKPWMLLATYICLLYIILTNLNVITNNVFSFLSLFITLFYGIAIAFILNIPMKKIEGVIKKHTKKDGLIYRRVRAIAITITLIVSFIVVAVLGSIILPKILESLIQLMSNLSNFFIGIVNNIDEIFIYFGIDFRMENIESVEQFVNMPWEKIVAQGLNILTSSANGIMNNAIAFTSTFALYFTGFMFSLYLLASKETFIINFRKVIVATVGINYSEKIFSYATKANHIFQSFVSGQLTEAVILMVLYYITMTILKFPFPELISCLIGVCSVVPVFGSMFAMSIGAIMILSVDPLQSLMFVLFYQVMQQFEDNLIYPRVVGDSVGLPGLWVLLSIFVFGDLFGIFGMVIAVPTTAFIYTVFGDIINSKLTKDNINVTLDKVVQNEEHPEISEEP